MGLQFQHPEFFITLLAVPFVGLLFWYLIRWKKSTTKKIGDPRLVSELTKSHSPSKFLSKFIIAALALTAVIIAVINPQFPGKMNKVERKGVDVMIALDVSNSMLAEDIKPNRLEKAKQLIGSLMSELQNDRVGLILFAGRAYMQMPLTTDHGAARMYVQNAGPLTVPSQGTMISEALRLGASAFNSKERKYKSIILITDGEDHDPASLEVAEQLAANGVMVNTVGIGSATGTPIPDPNTGQFKKDDQGNTVLSKLNEAELKQISTITQGIYVNTEDANAAAGIIMKKLSTIQETAIEDAAFKDYTHYFPWFAGLAILLLLIEFLLPERKMKMAIILLFVFNNTHAQDVDIINGNKIFKEGKYEDAEKIYDALANKTSNASIKQQLIYNKGVALSKQNKLEESIVTYKQAVIMNPEDEDARINLQKALLELKKKQPPPEKKEDPNKKKDKKQKKDQQQPQKNNLTKKEVERLMKALQQREQQVQQKMQENKTRNAGRQEKDW